MSEVKRLVSLGLSIRVRSVVSLKIPETSGTTKGLVVTQSGGDQTSCAFYIIVRSGTGNRKVSQLRLSFYCNILIKFVEIPCNFV